MENTTLIVLWFVYADSKLWFYYPGLVGQLASFFLCIILLTVYYSRLHPNKTTAVGICTKDAVCLSDVLNGSNQNGDNSPAKSPTRLGRLDNIQISN